MQVRSELKKSMQFIVVEKNSQMCFNENVKKTGCELYMLCQCAFHNLFALFMSDLIGEEGTKSL